MNSDISNIKIPHGMKVLMCIVDRGMGVTVEEIFDQQGCHYQVNILGSGTADRQILNLLGIGEYEKDVIFALFEADLAPLALKEVSEQLKMEKPGHGIGCQIDIASVGGLRALQIFTGQVGRKE